MAQYNKLDEGIVQGQPVMMSPAFGQPYAPNNTNPGNNNFNNNVPQYPQQVYMQQFPQNNGANNNNWQQPQYPQFNNNAVGMNPNPNMMPIPYSNLPFSMYIDEVDMYTKMINQGRGMRNAQAFMLQALAQKILSECNLNMNGLLIEGRTNLLAEDTFKQELLQKFQDKNPQIPQDLLKQNKVVQCAFKLQSRVRIWTLIQCSITVIAIISLIVMQILWNKDLQRNLLIQPFSQSGFDYTQSDINSNSMIGFATVALIFTAIAFHILGVVKCRRGGIIISFIVSYLAMFLKLFGFVLNTSILIQNMGFAMGTFMFVVFFTSFSAIFSLLQNSMIMRFLVITCQQPPTKLTSCSCC